VGHARGPVASDTAAGAKREAGLRLGLSPFARRPGERSARFGPKINLYAGVIFPPNCDSRDVRGAVGTTKGTTNARSSQLSATGCRANLLGDRGASEEKD